MKEQIKVGDWVQVRSKSEILQTLDENGELEGIPFMPEMVRFCGQYFKVYKRAHKTCDSVVRRARHLEHTVHLETRCSGEVHGGCQAGCLLFWKEPWLRALEGAKDTRLATLGSNQKEQESASRGSEPDIFSCSFVQEDAWIRYRCQATQIPSAGRTIRWWDMRQYLEDYVSGNVGLWRIICGATNVLCLNLARTGMGIGAAVRWFYDHSYFVWAGSPFPRRVGKIRKGRRTPVSLLNLHPGELVRVRSLEDIERTLDTAGQNRGLYFDPEQVPYVNGTYRVLRRVERIISEHTGRMLRLKTPAVALDAVVCQGRYCACRMFCPRSSYALWREGWLERVPKSNAFGPSAKSKGGIVDWPTQSTSNRVASLGLPERVRVLVGALQHSAYALRACPPSSVLAALLFRMRSIRNLAPTFGESHRLSGRAVQRECNS
jgi:hypothetical protein